jgi:hypothetical protein
LPGKICKIYLQIFLTGKYKTTEKIKDFFGWGKNQGASRDGASASGKPRDFGSRIRRFESCRPNWIGSRRLST